MYGIIYDKLHLAFKILLFVHYNNVSIVFLSNYYYLSNWNIYIGKFKYIISNSCGYIDWTSIEYS